LRNIKYELLRFFFGKVQGFAFLLLLLLLDNVSLLLIIDITDQEHGLEASKLWDDCLNASRVLLWVKIDVLEGTVIDISMDIVDEQELVSLELITQNSLNDVVRAGESNDFLLHSNVTLDVVRASKMT